MKNLFTFFVLIISGIASKAQFTKLLDFANTNGKEPYFGSFISDGTYLYGTTYLGGANGLGTIYKIRTDGTGDTILHSFSGVPDGRGSQGALVYDGTFFYGMTIQGGSSSCTTLGCGILYKIKPNGTGYDTVMTFNGPNNGSAPAGSLIYDGTYLYGMTPSGGANNLGTIFKIKTNGSGYVDLFDFNGATSGSFPFGALVSDGTFLYGMTQDGGSNADGVIFKIKKDGTNFLKLMDFDYFSSGSSPYGSLIFDGGTFLYGMTFNGGTSINYGTIFKIQTNGAGFQKLLDFNGAASGSFPLGSLVFDGVFLYGMTETGGTNGDGVIFRIMTDGTGFSKVFDFSASSDGTNPDGALISDGYYLYGTAQKGGANNMGTIFKFHPLDIGIPENNFPVVCDLYPNPSNGNFIIEVGLMKNDHTNLNVMNALGQIILEQKHDLQTGNNKFDLDLSSLSKGIYFIQIKTSTDVVTRKVTLN